MISVVFTCGPVWPRPAAIRPPRCSLIKPSFKFLCQGSTHPLMAAYLRADRIAFIPAWRMWLGCIYRRKQCMHRLGRLISARNYLLSHWWARLGTTPGSERYCQEASSLTAYFFPQRPRQQQGRHLELVEMTCTCTQTKHTEMCVHVPVCTQGKAAASINMPCATQQWHW